MDFLISDYWNYKAKADRYKDQPSKKSKYVRWSNKAAKVKFKLYSHWVDEQEEKDIEFRKLAERNREILSNLRFKGTVKSTAFSLFTTHSSAFSGRIRNNGVFVATVEGTGGFFSFFNSEYYKRYSGTIDCLGHFKVEGKTPGLNFYKSLPTTFEIYTNSKNQIELKTKEKTTDILAQGRQLVKEIIGKPFSDPRLQQEFLDNREKMYAILEERLKGVARG